MTNDDAPDKVNTVPLSRRQLLAMGGSGLATALAGCNGFSNDPGERPPPPGGNNGDYSDKETKGIIIKDLTLESTTFDMFFKKRMEKYDELQVIVRVHSSPHLDSENWTKIGEKQFTITSGISTGHSINLDMELNYAQQYHYTIEITNPEPEQEEEVYKTANVFLPYENKALGKTKFKTLGVPTVTEDKWLDNSQPVQKAELWFDEPDESPFNVPSVPEDQYDPEWYWYRDIKITAVVQFPLIETIADDSQLPKLQWVVLNLTLSEWEMLESFRWNSVTTHEAEHDDLFRDSGWEYDSKGSVIFADRSDRIINRDASKARTPFEQYRRRVDDVTNPLVFGGGRTFCKRAAEQIDQACDNPSFNTTSYPEYDKATLLKVFVGAQPYDFEVGGYNRAPEEVVEAWYRTSKGNSDLGAGDCVSASVFYTGIAVHLLDSPVCYLVMDVDSVIASRHANVGLLNFGVPTESLNIVGNHPKYTAGPVGNYEFDIGSVTMVECLRMYSTIGWREKSISNVQLRTYLTNQGVNSHVPVNENWEPDQSGQVKAPDDRIQIPWELADHHPTIENANLIN